MMMGYAGVFRVAESVCLWHTDDGGAVRAGECDESNVRGTTVLSRGRDTADDDLLFKAM